ncbi:ABC transporter permease [Paraburkholderia sediminicola]|uniref:ABC transporter permease n=1 Tax=Paraburkholderia sediminicola TaxID=458836 RepID=UPI0038B82E8E
MKGKLTSFAMLAARKLFTALVQLYIIATLVFSLMYVMPGDPVRLLLGTNSDPSPEAIAAMRSKLGLDQPVLTQYVHWLRDMLHFEFGHSVFDGYPIIDYIRSSLPNTLELALAAILIAIVIGVPLGIVSALRRGTPIDAVSTSVSTVGMSVPVYILGALFVVLFSLHLHWLPSSGYMDIARNPLEHFRRLVLPAFTLGFGLSASISRMTRSSMLDILSRDFVRTLRAKGTPERRIVWRHVLRNAAIPIVTIVGLQLGNLMGGTVLVEAMFNWPGLSTLLVDAVSKRNYPLVQGGVLTIAALYILINLGVDLVNGLLDPRIRRKRT